MSVRAGSEPVGVRGSERAFEIWSQRLIRSHAGGIKGKYDRLTR